MNRKVVSGIMLTLLLISMLTLSFNIQPVKSNPKTWTVDDDGPADFHTIQEAINAASDVDTIFVKNGTYCENVVLNKPNLTLIGENKHTTIIDGNGKTVVSLKVNDTKIKGFTVQNGSHGILMYPWTQGHLVSNSIILNNEYGISGHYDCGNVIICDNIITSNNITGIEMLFSHSVINNNLISDNGKGEFQEYSSGIHIEKGVNSKVIHCVNNTIFGNTIKNHRIGILAIQYSEENLFFHNNFINNAKQFHVPAILWNNSAIENYWNDYDGMDTNGDGIGDTPYIIDEDVQDKYPLMGMFYDFSTSLGSHVNVISNSTIEDFEYFESNNTIKMHVTNMTTDQIHGFCRLTIPHDLLSPPYNVTINNNLVTYTTVYENNTLSTIYFSYEHSTLEIVVIPEFPSTIFLSLFMILTLVVVVLTKKKRQPQSHPFLFSLTIKDNKDSRTIWISNDTFRKPLQVKYS